MTTLLSLDIPGCIGAMVETGNAKWSLKAGTRDNFEPTLVVAVCVRGVVAEEGYVQYKFRRCQPKLVVNKRWSLTRVVVQEGNYCTSGKKKGTEFKALWRQMISVTLQKSNSE